MAEAKAVAAMATAATPSAGMAVGGTNPVAADGVAADPVATNGQATESKKGGGGENDFIVSTAGNLLRYSVHFLSWAGDAIGEPIQSGAKANEEEEEAGEEEVEEVEEVDGEGGIDRALADVGGEGMAEGERGGGGGGGGGGRAGGGRGRRSRGKTRKEPRGSSPTVAVDAEAQSDPPLLPVGEGFVAFWLPLFLGVLALTTITNFSAGLNTGFHLGARSETGGSGHVTVLLEKCERGYFPGLRPRFRTFTVVEGADGKVMGRITDCAGDESAVKIPGTAREGNAPATFAVRVTPPSVNSQDASETAVVEVLSSKLAPLTVIDCDVDAAACGGVGESGGGVRSGDTASNAKSSSKSEKTDKHTNNGNGNNDNDNGGGWIRSMLSRK